MFACQHLPELTASIAGNVLSPNRILLPFLITLGFSSTVFGQPWREHGRMEVSKTNPHYLQYEDSTSFFWLGDTGWEMLHRLNREEIRLYLQNRKVKGFNVIQATIISEFIHSDKSTNYYGDSILVDEDPSRLATTPGNDPSDDKAYDFWDHVDYAVQTAAEQGLYLALVPSWGEWVTPRVDKHLFNTSDQAYRYGNLVGRRYQDAPNIIWILGGDRHPDERKEGIELWRAMAEGIADGINGSSVMDGKADYSTSIMTYHSYNSSSSWFHQDDWIDFHMWGSYHAEIDNPRAHELARADWNLREPKPTLNGEPCYEGHGINYAIDDNGYFTSTDVRIAAYWSVFSGSMGITYGAHPVWQFTDVQRKKLSPKTLHNWIEGMEYHGAQQMGHLRNLMESRPIKELNPDTEILSGKEGTCGDFTPVIRGKQFLMVYIPTGKPINIKMGTIQGIQVKAWWFNPRTGESRLIGKFENKGIRMFSPPGMSEELDWLKTGRGCDWVLILDDSSAESLPPGKL